MSVLFEIFTAFLILNSYIDYFDLEHTFNNEESDITLACELRD